MFVALDSFWADLYEDLEDPEFAKSFHDTLREFAQNPEETPLSPELMMLTLANVDELRPALETYRQSLRRDKGGQAAHGLVAIQHHGDYAEVVGGGQPMDDDPPLTLADLEGIGTPDLTMIVENLKRSVNR